MRISIECESEESLQPSPSGKWRTVISKLTRQLEV